MGSTMVNITIKASGAVLAVTADTPLDTALRLMERCRIRHLPVVRGPLCVGLLTERDLLRAAASTHGAMPPSVGRLCHTPAPWVDVTASTGEVAARMRAGGLDAVVIVRDDTLAGVLTAADLVDRVAMQAQPAG